MRDAVKAVVDQKIAEKKETESRTTEEYRRKARRPKIRMAIAGILTVALVASSIPAIAMWREPFPAPAGVEAERNARQAIVYAAGLVEGYASVHGQPPDALLDLGVELPGLSYVRTGNEWVLSMPVDGRPISLRSSDDRSRFLGPI